MYTLFTATETTWTKRERFNSYRDAMGAASEYIKLGVAVNFRVETAKR